MLDSTQNPQNLQALESLMLFTRAYHSAVETYLKSYGRHAFSHHGKPTTIIQIRMASDGYVTFYLTEPPDLPNAEDLRGYYAIDNSNHTLNTICQSTTLRYLKVSDGNIGQPWNLISPLPPDVDPPPDLQGNWFSTEIREAYRDGSMVEVPLPGMMISPIIDVKSGIRTGVVPARVKIWSPTVEIPGKGRVRLYDWTHADFWWSPASLSLDQSLAEELARNDLLALYTVLHVLGPLTPEAAQRDMSTHAADLLDKLCDQFLHLLEKQGDAEEPVHQWLNKREHHIFLDPNAAEVYSKVPFGNDVADFVIRRSDGTYLLSEIEQPNLRIFQQRNQEPTREFNHACQQVRDWQRYIRDNVHTVRAEQGIPDIYDPRGMVVIGRTRDIKEGEATIRWRDMKNRHEFALFTYDELSDRVRAIATSLRTMLRATT